MKLACLHDPQAAEWQNLLCKYMPDSCQIKSAWECTEVTWGTTEEGIIKQAPNIG